MTAEHDLIRIVYVSRVSSPINSSDMCRLVDQSAVNNARSALTGFLAFCDAWFLQALEGRADQVDLTFGRISQDKRHTEVHLLLREKIATRLFPQWDMGLAGFESFREHTLERYGLTTLFDVQRFTADRALGLLCELSTRTRKTKKGAR